MRVVVLGSWGIGEQVLRAALDTPGVEVAAVFTRRRDAGTSDPFRNLVADLAHARGIPVHEARESSGAYGARLLSTLNPDVVVSAAHPSLLGEEFLRIPRYGALNLHGSLLPRNRGTSPVNWALIRDEPETGLTMHYIDGEMDTGDVIYQQTVPITDTDTTSILSDRIKALAAPMIQRALRQLLDGAPLPHVPQDHSRVTYAPRLRGDDLLIDWNQPARGVWNFIRGTSQPGLGAIARTASGELRIWHSVIDALCPEGAGPGEVVLVNDEFLAVACSDRVVKIARGSAEIVELGNFTIEKGMKLESRVR